MCRRATVLSAAALWSLSAHFAAAQARVPTMSPAMNIDWRHIGNAAIELALPSVATGPVERVWYSPDAATIFARTPAGRTFATSDLEHWKPVADSSIVPPPQAAALTTGAPENGAHAQVRGARVYAFALNAYRSDDGGATWTNLTAYQNRSILAAAVSDLAVSPANPDEITVANAAGVWRSTDAGLTWTGLNDSLPNLPARRLLALPSGVDGIRIGLAVDNAPELEWAPGEKTAWRVSKAADLAQEAALKGAASQRLNATITAVASSGDTVYAGSSDGRLWTSIDRGATWSMPWDTVGAGPVEGIFVDPKDARTALAAFGAHAAAVAPGIKPVHVERTMNGGLFWDDSTTNLPDAAAHGITADRSSGAIYVATDAGVFFTATDLGSAGRTGDWTLVTGALPQAAAEDVRLDSGGNQIFVALAGYGVYAAIAPHRLLHAKVVNAADYSGRAAAPGSVLSILGARVTSALAGETTAPVLAAGDTASQVQIPFEASGENVSLSLDGAAGRIVTGYPLRSVSPAIFVDPDGSPLIIDSDSGAMLDASTTAHAGGRIQVLATGLGRVDPAWDAGTPAPATNPPKVVATVRAYINGSPAEVVRAVLAPQYIGLYSVEIQLPRIVNSGPAELYIEAEAQQSNRVRLYIEP